MSNKGSCILKFRNWGSKSVVHPGCELGDSWQREMYVAWAIFTSNMCSMYTLQELQ